MDHAARGSKALLASNYEEAIESYSAALKQSPTSPNYLIQRSTAYQRAKNYPLALLDANNTVVYANKRAKRELIIEAQFRRGCALYSLDRYGDAEFVFAIVKRMDEKHKMVGTWIQKTKMSLEKLAEDDAKRKCNVKETPELDEGQPTESENETSSVANGGAPLSSQATTTSAPGATPQQTPPDKIRHEWYQNSETVYFTLLAKGVPKDKCQIDIQERSLSISFPLSSTESTFDFTLEPLFAPVNVEKCIPIIYPSKIEVHLAKVNKGEKWTALESQRRTLRPNSTTTSATISAPPPATTGPAYPTSSKTGAKDWDKLIPKDIDEEVEGGDEANHFFKKLFKGSSPEVQKAMMKSYTESNGTALSTNWDEVSKGKVETVPPDGMEAKSWS